MKGLYIARGYTKEYRPVRLLSWLNLGLYRQAGSVTVCDENGEWTSVYQRGEEHGEDDNVPKL